MGTNERPFMTEDELDQLLSVLKGIEARMADSRPSGYGWTISWQGQSWEVNGCETLGDAISKCCDIAEIGGLKFRKRWWQFWRPSDPREWAIISSI